MLIDVRVPVVKMLGRLNVQTELACASKRVEGVKDMHQAGPCGRTRPQAALPRPHLAFWAAIVAHE